MASHSPGDGRKTAVPGVAGSQPPAVGTLLFDRYRLEDRLGVGGMAEVWRAHDVQLDRPVAVKLLHRNLLPDERSLERFSAEVRAAAGLADPGIVTVHDVLVDAGQAVVVMELVDGRSLSDVLATRGRLPEVAAAAITAQVAHALQAAHDRGFVHRAVRPGNVLLSPDGRARLVNFGVAHAIAEADAGVGLPGAIMGTLRYRAPEQVADGAADRATDVFGLGSLLYEMLVGRPPFPAATPAALMAQQRQGAPPALSASPELAGLARSALQYDPERRPRSAGRMAILIEGWLDHRGVSPVDLAAVTAAAIAGRRAPARPLTVASNADATGLDGAEPSSAPGQLAGAPGVGIAGPAAVGSQAASEADTAVSVEPPIHPAPATGIRPISRRPFALWRRRVPLVTAVGLAGLLLAGLLAMGAWTGLQAGSGSPAPLESASQSAAPTATPPPTTVPTLPALPPRAPGATAPTRIDATPDPSGPGKAPNGGR